MSAGFGVRFGESQRYVMRSDVRPIQRSLEDAADDVFGARNCSVITGEKQPVAIRMYGDVERGLDRREIAVELSEEADAVGKFREIDRSLGAQLQWYSSRKARGLPSTSAATIARTIARRLPKSRDGAARS